MSKKSKRNNKYGSMSESKRLKDVDFLSAQMDAMTMEAPDKLVQEEKWFCWDRSVVVALFDYVDNTFLAIAKCLETSQYMGRYIYFDEWSKKFQSKNDEVFYLEGSARWKNRISHARALSEDFDACAVGAVELDLISMAFHFNRENKTLLGVDTSGGFQVHFTLSLAYEFDFPNLESVDLTCDCLRRKTHPLSNSVYS